MATETTYVGGAGNGARSDRRRKRLRTAIVVVLLAIGIGYAWYDYRFPCWEERVTLPDGRTIEVKQRRDHIEGYGTRRTWLTFSLPEMRGKHTWSEWLQPTMIGVADGRVYVIGRPRGAKQFQSYGYPKYVYVAFEWKRGRFERIPFLSVPEPLRRRENVRWCLPGGEDSRKPSDRPDPSGWCSWPEPEYASGYFPRPQLVDLRVRAEEARMWARLAGTTPSTE